MSVICGSFGLFFLVVFRCSICCLISSGRIACFVLIFPLGMLCLSAMRIEFVSIEFAVCGFVGVSLFAIISSICCVKPSQFAFL